MIYIAAFESQRSRNHKIEFLVKLLKLKVILFQILFYEFDKLVTNIDVAFYHVNK